MNDLDDYDTISVDTLALEEMLQEERARELSQLNSLSKKVSNLHTSALYYRNTKSKMGSVCYDAWKTLIKKVGGTPDGWRDLGFCLGISKDDLDYIMNSVKDDPVDTVLKVYRQNERATLDKIVEALVKMKRYDILKSLEEPLSNLAQCFNKNDSGYHSSTKDSGPKEIISLTNIPNDLPPALNKNIVIKERDPEKPKQPSLRPSSNKIEKIKNEQPILFLTFTEDGSQAAANISQYVSNWSDITDVKIITLNSRKNEILQNPEKFIREFFEKANYVVPIITTGYINEITSNTASIPSTSDNLDFKYVNFIYNLIVTNYIHGDGCLNKKVRSVLPLDANVDIFKKVIMYPDLLPWTYEADFDEQFKAFLMEEYS